MPCSKECIEFKSVYNLAEMEVEHCELKLQELKEERSLAAGAAGGGVVLLAGVAVVSGPIGWIGFAGWVLLLGGGAISGADHLTIKKLRRKCKKNVGRMFDIYQDALAAGCEGDCLPPRTWVNRCR